MAPPFPPWSAGSRSVARRASARAAAAEGAATSNRAGPELRARYGQARVHLPQEAIADREATMAPETWRLARREGRLQAHRPGRAQQARGGYRSRVDALAEGWFNRASRSGPTH